MTSAREMSEADVEAVSAIRVQGWKCAYPGIVPQPYLDRMTVEEDVRRRRARYAQPRGRALDLVAVDGGTEVTGWACLGPYRGRVADSRRPGEVYALYVRPDLIGTGVGRALLNAVHAHAAQRRFDTLLLWVLDGNRRARRFYETAGYTPDGALQHDTYDGVAVAELRYRRAVQL